MSTSSSRRFLLTGSTGRLGSHVLRELVGRGLSVTAWGGQADSELFGTRIHPVDVSIPDVTVAAFREANPDTVIHTAAVSSVEDCERDPSRSRLINCDSTGLLAELAAETRSRFVLTSTDLVFDGEQGWYRESDDPNPLSTYGRTKATAEQFTLAVPGGVVARLSLLFGPTLTGRHSFFDHLLSAVRGGRPITLFTDEWRTPFAFPNAAAGLVEIALSDYCGLMHMGGPERLSRAEMGDRLARFLGCDPGSIVPTTRAEAGLVAVRPRDTSLDSSLWREQFTGYQAEGWEESLAAMSVA